MPAEKKASAPRSSFSSLLDALASVRFAVSVVILIAVACVLGTLVPQGADVGRAIRDDPGVATNLKLLEKVGLTHVYSAPWFMLLLAVLGASVATCGTRRFGNVIRSRGYARGRAVGSMLTHLSILLILAGGVVRGLWGEKGEIALHEGETAREFLAEDGGTVSLPFVVRLEDFEIETYAESEGAGVTSTADAAPAATQELVVSWPARGVSQRFAVSEGSQHHLAPPGSEDAFHIEIVRYVPDFVIDAETREVTARSNEPRNPAILVAVAGPGYQNHRWLFAKFPDFSSGGTDESPLRMVYEASLASPEAAAPPRGAPVKSYRSTVRIVETAATEAAESAPRTIEVNRPLTHGGYTFYQSGYDPANQDWTSFEVVRDPGVPLVYAGFLSMIIGLFTVFYLNPWLQGRSRS